MESFKPISITVASGWDDTNCFESGARSGHYDTTRSNTSAGADLFVGGGRAARRNNNG